MNLLYKAMPFYHKALAFSRKINGLIKKSNPAQICGPRFMKNDTSDLRTVSGIVPFWWSRGALAAVLIPGTSPAAVRKKRKSSPQAALPCFNLLGSDV